MDSIHCVLGYLVFTADIIKAGQYGSISSHWSKVKLKMSSAILRGRITTGQQSHGVPALTPVQQ